MAAIAAPLVEIVAARILTTLGIGVVVGGVTVTKEQIRTRQKEADRVKVTPIAQTAATTKRREKCPDCAPDKGTPFIRSTKNWSKASIDYQARIGGMPVGLDVITEWLFNGVSFDGFNSGECLLKEAKARHDQFFTMYRLPHSWWQKGANDIIQEAYRQAIAAQPRPPVQLRWYFMEPISYRYFSRIIQAAYPDIQVVFES